MKLNPINITNTLKTNEVLSKYKLLYTNINNLGFEGESSDFWWYNTFSGVFEDFEIICAELMLKDLEGLEKREEKVANLLKTAKSRNLSSQQIKELENEHELIQKVKPALQKGNLKQIQNIVKEQGVDKQLEKMMDEDIKTSK